MPCLYEIDSIGYKWVFWTKLQSNRELDKYKAMLMGKGYHEVEGLDFLESFLTSHKASNNQDHSIFKFGKGIGFEATRCE